MPENAIPSRAKVWVFKSKESRLLTRCCARLEAAGDKDCCQLLNKMSEQLEALTAWCNFVSKIDWAQVPGALDPGGGGGTPPNPPKWPP